jgi:hypothetical protein
MYMNRVVSDLEREIDELRRLAEGLTAARSREVDAMHHDIESLRLGQLARLTLEQYDIQHSQLVVRVDSLEAWRISINARIAVILVTGLIFGSALGALITHLLGA